MPSVVPSTPPLSSISDPNTRAVIQSIVDSQRIRNGEVGDGKQKFLTVADLNDAVSSSSSAGSRSATGAKTNVSYLVSGVVSALIQRASDGIVQSRLWKTLDEKITRIETPEWFRGKFGAAIKTVEESIESGNSAMAQQITTAVTNINGNIALVQDELRATSDTAGAAASKVTQLQTKVGEVDAAARQAIELAASVDGTVKGTWSVKFDVNGYVAGVALGVDRKAGSPPRSSFVVRADIFAVGSPGAQDTVPFIVQDGICYLKKAMIGTAWIDSAKIADAAITNAKIANLSVESLKIADHAVSQSFGALSANPSGGIFSSSTGAQVFFGGTVHITVEFLAYGLASCEYRLYRDGVLLRMAGIIGAPSYTVTYVDAPGAGYHTYSVSTTASQHTISMNVLEVVK